VAAIVNALMVVLAALALAVERVVYSYAWKTPDGFRAHAARLGLGSDPTRALERLFYAFKGVQAVVFLAWVGYFAPPGAPGLSGAPAAVWGGLALLLLGQSVNALTFYRLGRLGVFYGVRFGHAVPWCNAFPFSLLRHPQYVGTVLTIWGLFLALRFPAPDWYWLPLIETVYYAIGAHFESDDELDHDAISGPEPAGISEEGDCA
jgi:methylene-fatty-acyl-phospholipid synthase